MCNINQAHSQVLCSQILVKNEGFSKVDVKNKTLLWEIFTNKLFEQV